MAPLTGVRLTLPNNEEYRIKSHTDVSMEQVWQFLFNGGEQAVALFEQFFAEEGGQSGRGDGLKQSAALGTGAGRHIVTVDAIQYVESDDEWGGLDLSTASSTTIRDKFNNALNTTRIASDNPALFETGEYSSGGMFDPLPVVMQQSNIGTAATEDGHTVVTINLQMLEAADVSEAIHGSKQSEA